MLSSSGYRMGDTSRDGSRALLSGLADESCQFGSGWSVLQGSGIDPTTTSTAPAEATAKQQPKDHFDSMQPIRCLLGGAQNDGL